MLKAVGSRKNLEFLPFYFVIEDLVENDAVQTLRLYRHHLRTTRFQHSLNVSYYNYLICKRLGLDATAAARAGMLHDLYFYNRKDYIRQDGEQFHNARHPRQAWEAASQLFSLNAREQDIILKHMWPVTPTALPRYRETVVIVLVDKYCAVLELMAPTFRRFFHKRTA